MQLLTSTTTARFSGNKYNVANRLRECGTLSSETYKILPPLTNLEGSSAKETEYHEILKRNYDTFMEYIKKGDYGSKEMKDDLEFYKDEVIKRCSLEIPGKWKSIGLKLSEQIS